jgi:alpha-beta hydrolase superfamily lysophospholipase
VRRSNNNVNNNLEVKTIAHMCIVHGFGHYSGEFYELANFLSKNGIICHLVDLRGHGYSGGVRLDWTIDELHSDALTLLKQVEYDEPDLPVYVFGHSMGGGLISSLFINNPSLQVNGIILSAPLIGLPLTIEHNKFKLNILDQIGENLRVKLYFTYIYIFISKRNL